MKTTELKSGDSSIILFLTLLAILFVVFLTFSFVRIDKQLLEVNNKLDAMVEHCDDLVYENEILWTYVENIDTCTSLEDAIEKRDDIYDLIQFIDE